jgi:sugar/nucleoside kinase (ribokinase family)
MYDFIAIGETDTDIFIHLQDESGAKIEGADGEHPMLSIPFAAKIPYESATTISGVGNAPNAAVSAAKLGLKSALYAHVGDDEGGRNTIASLKEHGVDTSLVAPEAGKKTSHSYILWYGQDRTILRRHEDFSYTFPDLGSPKWAYFSAMGSKVDTFYDDFAAYIETHPEVKFAFQPGGNEVRLGTKLLRFYKRADIYFSNVEEAEAILGLNTLGIQELLKRFRELGPKIVVITDGPKGAYAYDGTTMYQQLPYPDPKPPLERTGAGDSFSSACTVALALGKTLPEALQWGAINAMNVVQHVGGQEGLLSRPEIEEYLKKASVEFQTKKI